MTVPCAQRRLPTFSRTLISTTTPRSFSDSRDTIKSPGGANSNNKHPRSHSCAKHAPRQQLQAEQQPAADGYLPDVLTCRWWSDTRTSINSPFCEHPRLTRRPCSSRPLNSHLCPPTPNTSPTWTPTACSSTGHLAQGIALRCGLERGKTSIFTRTLASTSFFHEQRWNLPTIAECSAGVINLPDASTVAATNGSGSVPDSAPCSTGPSTEMTFGHCGRSARATFASLAANTAGSQDLQLTPDLR